MARQFDIKFYRRYISSIIGVLLMMKFVKPINKKKIFLVGSITILSGFSFMVSSGYLTFFKKKQKKWSKGKGKFLSK